MSSVNVPKQSRHDSKVLLRSTSFQRLCSLSYSFKIEAIQSYKEHIKTVIKLLKAATRAYLISVYFRCITIVFFNVYISSLYTLLKTYFTTDAVTKVENRAGLAGDDVGINQTKNQQIPGHIGERITIKLLIIYKHAIQTFLTYTCIVYIGFQTIWLLNALWWSANVPYGLLFLMLDLGYMGFIMAKIAVNGSKFPL